MQKLFASAFLIFFVGCGTLFGAILFDVVLRLVFRVRAAIIGGVVICCGRLQNSTSHVSSLTLVCYNEGELRQHAVQLGCV